MPNRRYRESNFGDRRSAYGPSMDYDYDYDYYYDEDEDQDYGYRGRPMMTTSEAGRRGGRRTAQTHGRDFYQNIGRKGGETVSREYGPEFYSEIGRKGGRIGGHKGGQRVRELISEGYQYEGTQGPRGGRRFYYEDEDDYF